MSYVAIVAYLTRQLYSGPVELAKVYEVSETVIVNGGACSRTE